MILKKVLIVLFIVLILSAVTVLFIYNISDSHIVIEGIVKNKGSGVPRAYVVLKDARDPNKVKNMRTDEDGKFIFKLEPRETNGYIIRAGYNDNGEPYSNSVLVENKTQTISIELLPTIRIYGSIYDSNGIPLHDCHLVFKTGEMYHIDNNVKNGAFHLSVPKNQHYHILSNVIEEDKNTYIKIGEYTVTDNISDQINIHTDFTYKLPVIREITYAKYVHPFDKMDISVNAISKSENEPLIYRWKCSGGTITGKGKLITWEAPEKDGTYEIVVEVTDRGGLKSSKSILIDVGPPLYEKR